MEAAGLGCWQDLLGTIAVTGGVDPDQLAAGVVRDGRKVGLVVGSVLAGAVRLLVS